MEEKGFALAQTPSFVQYRYVVVVVLHANDARLLLDHFPSCLVNGVQYQTQKLCLATECFPKKNRDFNFSKKSIQLFFLCEYNCSVL